MRLPTVALFVLSLLAGGCTTVRPGEVAVRQSFGKLQDTHRDQGLIVHSPIGIRFVKVPTRTQNVEVPLDLPSREGVNVNATVSILYNVDAEQASSLIQSVGVDFQNSLVLPVFRSAAADVTAEYAAKDMYSGERASIEVAIGERMNATLQPRGIRIEKVLMKSIQLPAGLAAAIEDKLAAEQEAERMRFVLDQERREAERRRIEAEGIRDAQFILEEGLSEQILRWRSIEAFQELASSPGTRVIVTDGQLPFLIDDPPPPPVD